MRITALAALVLATVGVAAPTSAQLAAAKEGPIVYGHHHIELTEGLDKAQ